MKRWMVAIGAGLWISALAPGLSVTAQAEWVEEDGESFVMVVTPDHPTPVRLKTHTRGGVPCMIYRSGQPISHDKTPCYCEEYADAFGVHMEGYKMMDHMMKQTN